MLEEPWHGSTGGYTNHKCRCQECRTAWTAHQKDANHRRHLLMLDGVVHPPHGEYNTYRNYECRCGPCKAANAERSRKRYRSV